MKVSLEKHIKTIINSNDKHLREVLDLKEQHLRETTAKSERFNAEIFRVFKETTDVHLLHLNNTYNIAKDTVAQIAAKTVSTDEHEGFKEIVERRFGTLEGQHREEKGENKVSEKKETKNEKLYYFIAGGLLTLIPIIINYFLK